jgi:hypothetical protein
MPSVISHAVVAGAAGVAFAPQDVPNRFWPIAVACSVIPDMTELFHCDRGEIYSLHVIEIITGRIEGFVPNSLRSVPLSFLIDKAERAVLTW